MVRRFSEEEIDKHRAVRPLEGIMSLWLDVCVAGGTRWERKIPIHATPATRWIDLPTPRGMPKDWRMVFWVGATRKGRDPSAKVVVYTKGIFGPYPVSPPIFNRKKRAARLRFHGREVLQDLFQEVKTQTEAKWNGFQSEANAPMTLEVYNRARSLLRCYLPTGWRKRMRKLPHQLAGDFEMSLGAWYEEWVRACILPEGEDLFTWPNILASSFGLQACYERLGLRTMIFRGNRTP